jgi:hypothetical protein
MTDNDLKTLASRDLEGLPPMPSVVAEGRRRQRRRRTVRVGLAAASIIGAVAGASGLPIPRSGDTITASSGAFVLAASPGGTITVTIAGGENLSATDADELESALEAHGIAADVVSTPPQRRCQPGRFEHIRYVNDHDFVADRAAPLLDPEGDGTDELVFRPSDFAPDQTVVIWQNEISLDRHGKPLHGGDGGLFTLVTAVATGPVEECVLQPDPEEPVRPERANDGDIVYRVPENAQRL